MEIFLLSAGSLWKWAKEADRVEAEETVFKKILSLCVFRKSKNDPKLVQLQEKLPQ